MLARKFRLPLGGLSIKNKKISTSPYFSIRAEGNRFGYNRFAVIISNKVSKKSSKRHYLKRLLVGLLGGWPDLSTDFLLIVSPGILDVDAETIKKEMDRILSRLKIKV